MSLRRRLFRLLMITLLTPVVFLLACQSRLIYFARPYAPDRLKEATMEGVVPISYTTAQGQQTAHYLPARNGTPRKVWLCYSGNASTALDWLYYVPQWSDENAFLMIDYPGYGACQGEPSPQAIRESSKAALAALKAAHSLDGVTVAVLGHSIGAAAALMAARDLQLHEAILVSPFTSMAEMADEVFFPPLGMLTRHRYDNRQELTALLASNPAFHATLLHGDEDKIIPIRMSEELITLDMERVKLIPIPRAGHNDILDIAHRRIEAAVLSYE